MDLIEEACFALRLTHLRPDRTLDPAVADDDALALVMALEGHRDSRFALQVVAWPEGTAGTGPRLDHAIVGVVEGASGAGPDPLRVAEVADDLGDVLALPPTRWSLERVDHGRGLDDLLAPFAPLQVAEIVRREEPCSPVRWGSIGAAGFGSSPAAPALVRTLWSLWTLGPAVTDLRRLASVLLAQEHPVCLRVVLCPTELTATERTACERLQMEIAPLLPEGGLLRASMSTIEAFLYLRPMFEVRCLVASTGPVSRTLLSAIGATFSPPGRHGRTDGGMLTGGFAVLRSGVDVPLGQMEDAYHRLWPGAMPPTLAPPGLGRLRRLVGPWEAANLFRLPITDGEFPGVTIEATPALPIPGRGLATAGSVIGQTFGASEEPVRVDPESRFRHVYVCGQTGTGKSTLLHNLALQDVMAGAGVAVVDPHGDLVDALLCSIPAARRDDVVLVDPADPVAVAGIDLLEAESPIQAEYLVSELCTIFYELFDPNRVGIIGPRFESMLRQAALLLIAHPERRSSFLDLGTLFVDDAVRRDLVEGVEDPVLAEFWLGEMQMDRSNEWQEVVSWFRSKFEVFRTSRLVRNVLGQATSTISFRDVLDRQQILLVDLAKGRLGAYNSALIGHIVMAKLWAAALERAAQPVGDRPDFFVYVDEFQNVTGEALPSMLSEARKFRLGFTLANQFFTQVPERTRDAIMGNVGTRVTFRLGPKDGEPFATWLGGNLRSDDLGGLPNFVAIAALNAGGVPLEPIALRTAPALGEASDAAGAAARAASRSRWARPVDEIDREFFERWRSVPGSVSSRLLRSGREPIGTRPSILDEFSGRRGRAGVAPTDPADHEAVERVAGRLGLSVDQDAWLDAAEVDALVAAAEQAAIDTIVEPPSGPSGPLAPPSPAVAGLISRLLAEAGLDRLGPTDRALLTAIVHEHWAAAHGRASSRLAPTAEGIPKGAGSHLSALGQSVNAAYAEVRAEVQAAATALLASTGREIGADRSRPA